MVDCNSNDTETDDLFPKALTASSEDLDKHLFHRLHLRYRKSRKDLLSSRKSLESRSMVKQIDNEALEALKQKILVENIRREQEQRNRRLKAFGHMKFKNSSTTEKEENFFGNFGNKLTAEKSSRSEENSFGNIATESIVETNIPGNGTGNKTFLGNFGLKNSRVDHISTVEKEGKNINYSNKTTSAKTLYSTEKDSANVTDKITQEKNNATINTGENVFGNVENNSTSTKNIGSTENKEQYTTIFTAERHDLTNMPKQISLSCQEDIAEDNLNAKNKIPVPFNEVLEKKVISKRVDKNLSRRRVSKHYSLLSKRELHVVGNESDKKYSPSVRQQRRKSLPKHSSTLCKSSNKEPRYRKARSYTLPSQPRDTNTDPCVIALHSDVTTMVSLLGDAAECACPIDNPMEDCCRGDATKSSVGFKSGGLHDGGGVCDNDNVTTSEAGFQYMEDRCDSLVDHFERGAESKGLSSNVFPPLQNHVHYLTTQSNDTNPSDETIASLPATKETPTLAEPPLKSKTLGTKWREESSHLNMKIKEFVSKPIPTLPPSSLKVRRSTIHNIDLTSLSSKRSGGSELAHVMDRKKTHGVVNLHTCPTLNIFKDRSWMYQDRLGKKCRYIRAPSTPVPPVDHIFDQEYSRK